MSSKKQTLASGQSSSAGSSAPVGDQVGAIDAETLHAGGMKPNAYLITAVVSGSSSDLRVWGRARGVWGLHNGRYGQHPGGLLGTALAAGAHHFVVEDLGVYDQLYFVKSAGTVDVTVLPILFSNGAS